MSDGLIKIWLSDSLRLRIIASKRNKAHDAVRTVEYHIDEVVASSDLDSV